MKVLQVGKYYPPVEGGIENHVHSLSRALAERHEVTVLVFNTGSGSLQETRDGLRVVRAGTLGKLFSTEMAPSFFRWFRRLRQVDLIHLHTPNPIGELACLMAPRGSRLVITYHSDVVRQRLLGRLNRLVLHRLMKRADRIVAFTRRYMESSPVLKHYVDKCAIIPHGIDLAEMELTPAILDKARKVRAEHGPRIALFVGRLVYYKGVDILLAAIAQVPGAVVLVAGDGPLRESLSEMARGLGLSDRVKFLGRVSHEDKVALYSASDFLVLPATHRSEAFGLVQVEAFACGLPVISTDIDSGVPFVNQHEQTGLVVPPADPEALAAAMSRLFADEPLRARLGKAARRRVEELFSRDVMVHDMLAMYEQTVACHGEGCP